MSALQERYTQYLRRLDPCGQSHLLAFWPKLDDARRAALLHDLDRIDFGRCLPLVESHVRRQPAVVLPERIEPPAILPHVPDAARVELYGRARRTGEAAVREGRVAAFTVAGGQGTRLGFDGPKGAFRITPIRSLCLFHLFAEFLLGIGRRYGRCPRWYVMTSSSNHAATIELFETNKHFGLNPAEVVFFAQGQMPAFHPDGKMALAQPHRVALSPDGHGGSLQALAGHGALADMRERGIEVISYFQVDNPLAKPIDPLFIGLHLETQSEMGSKAVTKADDLERVGNFCLADGKLAVIEYTDLPEELARERNADGSRRFDAGSIAIHTLSRSFVERLTAKGSRVRLPWHRAEKRVATVDSDGAPVRPASPNAIKLEMFVFDAIPRAANAFVLYTPREEEFSPIKNAEGVDSPASARRDLIRRDARWLEACGCEVPRDGDGEPALPIEISPAFALDADDLGQRLDRPPRLEIGQARLLA